jgi:hypothetical protein
MGEQSPRLRCHVDGAIALRIRWYRVRRDAAS